jgi:hypothetical protein
MVVGVAVCIFLILWKWCCCCVGRGWSLHHSQVLDHGSIEPCAALFVGDLADKAAIPVGRPIPHLGKAVCELAL